MFRTQQSSTSYVQIVNFMIILAIKAKQRHGFDIINGMNQL